MKQYSISKKTTTENKAKPFSINDKDLNFEIE